MYFFGGYLYNFLKLHADIFQQFNYGGRINDGNCKSGKYLSAENKYDK